MKGIPFLYRIRLCQNGYNVGIIKIVAVDSSMSGPIGDRGIFFILFVSRQNGHKPQHSCFYYGISDGLLRFECPLS